MKILMNNGRAIFKYGALSKNTAPDWWSNCELLSHFDGVDDATEAIDISDNNFALTFNGGAKLDTAISKFGTASLLCTGTTPYVETPVSSKFNLYNKSYTISFWLYISNADMCTNSAGIGLFETGNDHGITECRIRYSDLSIIVNNLYIFGQHLDDWALSVGWHHFEFNYDYPTTTYRVFQDGNMTQSKVSPIIVQD